MMIFRNTITAASLKTACLSLLQFLVLALYSFLPAAERRKDWRGGLERNQALHVPNALKILIPLQQLLGNSSLAAHL